MKKENKVQDVVKRTENAFVQMDIKWKPEGKEAAGQVRTWRKNIPRTEEQRQSLHKSGGGSAGRERTAGDGV